MSETKPGEKSLQKKVMKDWSHWSEGPTQADRREDQMAMEENDLLKSLTVVLHETRYPENIGAAARACKNMGVGRLLLVRPERLDMGKVLKMATHEARDIVERTIVYESLERALSHFTYVIGTTARTGRQRRPTHTPRQLAQEMPGILANNRVAILFGSEKFGLDNHAIGLCNALVTIPTTGFSSLNLAQSVMVILYEIFYHLSTEQQSGQIAQRPRMATVRERQGMFDHLLETFDAMGLFEKQPPDYWLRNAKRVLNRKDLTARDVKTIRGFCRQVQLALGRIGTTRGKRQ